MTLHKRGELRGCIGSLAAVESVADGVKRNALNAAFNDYRFEPLTAAEAPTLHVEISVLTNPEPLLYETGDDLLRCCDPGPGTRGESCPDQGERRHLCPRCGVNCPNPKRFLANSATRPVWPPTPA